MRVFDKFKYAWFNLLENRGEFNNTADELGYLVKEYYGDKLSKEQIGACLASASRHWNRSNCVELLEGKRVRIRRFA
jgi:hypothetical protein